MTELYTPALGVRRRYSLVVVTDTYPPVVGGAEMDAQRVSAELIRRGHQVTVFCSGGGPMPRVRDWRDGEGVPVRILTGNGHGRQQHVAFALNTAWELWRTRTACDIVFFSMSGLYLATGLLVSHLLGKTIVSKMHGSTVIPSMARSFIGRLELRMLAKWAARVMVLNDEMVQEALDAGIPQRS